MGMTDVYAAILPGLAFKPVFHVHYAEVGGSGETMPE